MEYAEYTGYMEYTEYMECMEYTECKVYTEYTVYPSPSSHLPINRWLSFYTMYWIGSLFFVARVAGCYGVVWPRPFYISKTRFGLSQRLKNSMAWPAQHRYGALYYLNSVARTSGSLFCLR
jgi:hypothetical protein